MLTPSNASLYDLLYNTKCCKMKRVSTTIEIIHNPNLIGLKSAFMLNILNVPFIMASRCIWINAKMPPVPSSITP